MYKIIGADHKEYGPVSPEQLRQWFAEGRVNAATRVQAEGSGLWKPLSEWPDFAGLFPAGPPPGAAPSMVPPPVSLTPHTTGPVTNKMAAWSMGVGIFSIISCCCWPIGVVAIVLGLVAMSQIKANPNQTGQGFAIAGVVTGAVSLLIGIAGMIAYWRNPELLQSLQNFQNQLNR